MSDFWTSDFGQIVRRFGVWAAGAIPFIGPLAQQVVSYFDQKTFAKKTNRPASSASPAPRAAATTTATKPTSVWSPKDVGAGGTREDVDLFDAPANTPADAVSGGSNDTGSGLDDFLPSPARLPLQSVSPESGGYGVAVAVAVVIILLALFFMKRGRG